MSDHERRVGVFSDIHGNYHALRAVIGSLDDHGIEEMFCCGDVVGYGAHPNECCALLRERRIPTIAGNHDHAALLRTNIGFFNDIAKAAVLWTKDTLTPENTEFLANLPLTMESGEFCFVHGSPESPDTWKYVLTLGDAKASFECFQQRFCFIGHSHQPFLIEWRDGVISCPSTPIVEIQDDSRYLINVGSVGQPRDRNPMACFVIVDQGTRRIEFHRAPYDLEAAQRAILDCGLPAQLAERLAFGA
ncbi:MAG: metallophosphoesterase family protein [Candidatus Sumerlaeota bacterium]|nr:metallophosphoesterase family protein [Candidatus Sumerlaeota bacterium]